MNVEQIERIMNHEEDQGKVVSASRPGVLLIGNFLSATRGTRSVCEDLAVGLRAAGWPIITSSSCSGRVARMVDFLMTVWKQRNRYKIAQVDVYSGPSFLWAELVCWALRTMKKPYILTLHGGNLPAFAKRHNNRVQRLLRTAYAVTTPSGYLFEQMKVYRQDLIRLPNSLDLKRYTFKQRTRPAPNLVWLRAFHDIYNPSLAVRVVAFLVKDLPAARLVMIGPDKKDGSFELAKKLALELGVFEKISFPGPVPKAATPEWINGGDILLNTPRIDNTPVSVLEAMACGVCIVSTNVGGIPYLLENDHDALLVPDDDELAMAHAVQRLVSEVGIAERLSRNGRRKVDQFDWSTILPMWEQLFSNGAERRTA